MEPSPEITFEQIRERAYELWERNHRPDGLEIEFWLAAERELRAERARKQGEASADKADEAPAAPSTNDSSADVSGPTAMEIENSGGPGAAPQTGAPHMSVR